MVLKLVSGDLPETLLTDLFVLKSPDHFLPRPRAVSSERRGPLLADRSEGGEGEPGVCRVGR